MKIRSQFAWTVLGVGLVLIGFQNFDDVSLDTTASAPLLTPTVIINHDLWSYEIAPKMLDLNADNTPTVGLTPEETAQKIGEDLARPAAAGPVILSLNGVSGSNYIWYWDTAASEGKSYAQWLQSLLCPSSSNCLLSFEARSDRNLTDESLAQLDNFSRAKAERKNLINLIADSQAMKDARRKGSQFFVSIRMNDKHILEGTEDFLPENINSTVASAKTLRRPADLANFFTRVAALSPEYLDFLGRGSVISENGTRGSVATSLGCDKYNVLNFSSEEVRQLRFRQVRSLLINSGPFIDGIELDYTRTPCMFDDSVSLQDRRKYQTALLRQINGARQAFNQSSGRNVKIILRLPLDQEDALAQLGLDTIGYYNSPYESVRQSVSVDGIIASGYFPFSDVKITNFKTKGFALLPIAGGPSLTRVDTLEHLFQGAPVFPDFFPFADAETWTSTKTEEGKEITTSYSMRRPYTWNEQRTMIEAHLANGADGVSFFNYQYLPTQAASFATNAVERLDWLQLVCLGELNSEPCRSRPAREFKQAAVFNFRNLRDGLAISGSAKSATVRIDPKFSTSGTIFTQLSVAPANFPVGASDGYSPDVNALADWNSWIMKVSVVNATGAVVKSGTADLTAQQLDRIHAFSIDSNFESSLHDGVAAWKNSRPAKFFRLSPRFIQALQQPGNQLKIYFVGSGGPTVTMSIRLQFERED